MITSNFHIEGEPTITVNKYQTENIGKFQTIHISDPTGNRIDLFSKDAAQFAAQMRKAADELEGVSYPSVPELLQQRDDLMARCNELLEDRRTAELVPFLVSKAQWSLETFGPGPRTKGICEHIRKELSEIEAAPLDLEEWVDVFMLSTDGYWRAWYEKNCEELNHSFIDMALDFIRDCQAKHNKNVNRQWPAVSNPDLPSEHDRSAE